MKRMPFEDASASVALDCELVSVVNRIVWKNIHRGFMGIAEKLRQAGIVANCIGYFGHRELYQKLMNDILSDETSARKIMFPMPIRKRCSSAEEYVEHKRIHRRALRARLIFWGNLFEHDMTDSPPYRTSFAVLRVPKTNQCLVFIAACE